MAVRLVDVRIWDIRSARQSMLTMRSRRPTGVANPPCMAAGAGECTDNGLILAAGAGLCTLRTFMSNDTMPNYCESDSLPLMRPRACRNDRWYDRYGVRGTSSRLTPLSATSLRTQGDTSRPLELERARKALSAAARVLCARRVSDMQHS